MAAKRIEHPAYVALLVLTDADTGRKVAINTGWMLTFTEGDRRGTTVIRFMNGDLLTVEESFIDVARSFPVR